MRTSPQSRARRRPEGGREDGMGKEGTEGKGERGKAKTQGKGEGRRAKGERRRGHAMNVSRAPFAFPLSPFPSYWAIVEKNSLLFFVRFIRSSRNSRDSTGG